MNWVWPESKAVHTFEINQVTQILNKINLSDFTGSVINKKKCLDDLEKSTTYFKDWVSKIIDLSSFGHAYAVNGVTDAINHWLLNEKRGVQRFRGDYNWPNIVRPDIEVLGNLSMINPNKVLYVSNPSSEDGCYRDDWDDILEKAQSIVLDCAYVGSVPAKKIRVTDAVETIFFSYSKAFGLNRLRLGWMFSRKSVPTLNALNSVAYFPSLIIPTTSLLTKKFRIDDIYQLMRPAQESICCDLSLKPSDSYLIGSTSAEHHPDWSRENGPIARIPLANFYLQMKQKKSELLSEI